MKDSIKITIAFLLCLCFFLMIGTKESSPETDSAGIYCRVEAVTEDGIVLSEVQEDALVLVRCAQPEEYQIYDTVVIEFNESDLQPVTGSIPVYDDYQVTYSYLLETHKSLRPAGPGEPTFA